ncbi:Ig-like domain-containing protein [Deminuibacter soli]|nr:gliding motility-associated C-terminal domain-containing protein [Deminuibacter soli]
MKKIVLLACWLCAFTAATYAHTLNAGDVVVYSWNSFTDEIKLTNLVDIPAGTVLKITDRGWDNTNHAFTTLTTGDGTVTWTVGSFIPKGSLFTLKLGGSDEPTTLANTTTTTDLTANISTTAYSIGDPMTIAGDGIFIYQDADNLPYFIFGYNNSSGTNVDANGWNTSIGVTLRDSQLPDGNGGSQNALTNGTNAVAMPGSASQQDNTQYTGPTTSADAATWLARITTQSNWTGTMSATNNTSIINTSITFPTPPVFNNTTPTLTYCGNAGTVLLNSLLAATDLDNGQTLTWTVITAPAHSTAVGFPYSATSNGGSVTPAGLSITPTAGYSGTDAMVVQVSDGTGNAQVTINITVNAAPAIPTITPGGTTTFCTGGSVTLTSSAATGNQWYKDGAIITGAIATTYAATSTGNYTVTVTNASGCTATSTATAVTVNAPPATPAITPGGPTSFCTGGSVTLTSSAATNNQWYKEGAILTGEINTTYNATASGSYTVTVTNVNGCTATSTGTTVTVNTLPATPIVTAGSTTTFCAGGSVTLTSSAATNNQWYKDGAIITGATATTYSATTSGNYTVTVTNGSGCTATSTATAVTVNALPATLAITPGGPTSFCTGGSVTLTSSAATNNQWYKDGAILTGEINTTYNATASGSYTVTVTNGNGCTATSTGTTVTVNTLPATPIVTAGSTTTFCAGGSVTLTSSAATNNQWYKDGAIITGATATTYSATTSGNYTVTVTNGSGCTATSTATAVTVNALPATLAITPGGPTSFCTGGSVTLTSSAATNNQWYKDGAILTGEINTTYNATASGSYTVTVTNGSGCTATSTATAVTVNALPATPTIMPGGPTTFCTGGSVTLTSSAATNNQWYKDGTIITGAIATTYAATSTGNYTVTVTNASGCTATSTATAITVNALPATPAITPGGPTSFCTGGNVVLTSSAATGNQWYSNGTAITGETNTTYTANTSANYTVTTTDGNGCSATSTATTVAANPLPAVPTITAGTSTTFCAGGSVTLTSSAASGNQWYKDGTAITGEINTTYAANASGSYTVVATNASGCTATSTATAVTVNALPATPAITPGGPTSFCTGGNVVLTSSAASGNQWYKDGTAITGETNTTYTANTSANYTVTTTDGNGCSATSTATTVAANPLPAVPTITAGSSTTFCAGGSVTLTSSAATGNQWYKDGTAITGEINTTYAANASGSYTVVATNASGCTATSTATAVTVNALPATPAITPGGPTSFCTGGSVVLTSSATSGNQWYRDGTAITGETNTTYTANTSANYTVITTDGNGCSATSTATTVAANPLPAVPTITTGSSTTFCAGGSVTLTSSAATGNQWYKDGTAITGEINTTYAANASGSYTVTVTNASGCTATSTGTTVTVNPLPATPAITAGGPTSFCTGGNVVLTSSAASGNQWYRDGAPIVGETNNTYTATTNGSYTVSATNASSCSAGSAATDVTTIPYPATPVVTASGTVFCTGGSVTLTSSATANNQWYKSGTPISGATAQTYSVTAAGDYRVGVSNSGGCMAQSLPVTITETTGGVGNVQVTAGGPLSFCDGGSVTFTSSAAAGNQWLKDGTPISGATAATYTANASGSYAVTVTGSNGCAATTPGNAVTVNPLPVFTITSDKGNSLSRGESTRLSITGATGTVTWQPAATLDFPLSLTPQARPLANTTYTATLTSAQGCQASQSISISVTEDFKVTPKIVVTPNGDGINDYFVIDNIDAYPNNSLQVFDRSGKLVYEKQNYRNDWDGKLRGRAFISDTYFYVLIIEGRVIKKGTIAVIR